MRIALFSDCYTPVRNGVVSLLRTLKVGLEREGDRVLLFAPSPHFEGWQLNEDPREPGLLRVPSLPVNRRTGDRLALIPPLIQRAIEKKLKQEKIQIIHVHTEFSLARSGARAAARLNIPLGYTPHTRWEEYRHYLPPTYLLPKLWIPRFLTAPLKRCCRELAVPSAAMARRMTILMPGTPCRIIPNGICREEFLTPGGTTLNRKREDPSAPGRVTLIYAGRIGSEKRILPLVKALIPLLKEEPQLKMKILGSGPQAPTLKRIIRRSGLKQRLDFPGTVPWEEMAGHYQEADLFISASLSEVNPMTALEALACGLPLIVPQEEGFETLVEPEQNGWKAADIPEILIRVKAFLALSGEQRFAMSQASIALFHRRFSEKRLRREYRDWYEKLKKQCYNGRVESSEKDKGARYD